MKFSHLLIATFTLAGMQSYGQQTQQSVESVESKSSEGYDQADELITNRRFRASTGSLSDWSINSSFAYDGGSLSDPLNVERPNLNAAGDVAAIQGVSGNVGISYRLTKKDRLNFGIGLRMLAPFHSSIDTENARTRTEFENNQGDVDVNDPNIAYTRIGNISGIQSVFSVTGTNYTTGNLTDLGFDYRVRATWNTMYDFGDSGFSAGFLFLGSRFINEDLGPEIEQSQLENEFAVLPQFEYVINDTLNLRTITRAYWYQSNAATGDYKRLEFTQSAGLGISVNRDLFLYPNIQFKPRDLKSDSTNIGLSANLNIF